MKYFLSCTVALVLSIFVQVTAQDPQKPVYKKLNVDPAYQVTVVSPNGKFIAGCATYRELAFCYNMETEEATYLDEEGQAGISAKGITDEGMIVGTYGKSLATQMPALWKNGAWELLPVPGNVTYNYGAANSITTDQKIIVGYYDNSPCYWVLTNGKYEYNDLPCEKKDWNGQKPQWITAYGVSNDGNTIFGAICDRRNVAVGPLPTVWTRNSEGKYDLMKTLCFDVCLNREFLPGPGAYPEYKDYVTAPQGTPEYDEQMAEYNEVRNKYVEEYNKCIKDSSVNAQSGTLSPDGKYITLTLKTPYRDPENPWVRSTSVPMRVEVATDRAEIYKTTDENGNLLTPEMSGSLTDKDGVLFATVRDGFYIVTTFVFPTVDSKPVEFYKWVKEKYNLDITGDLTYHIEELEKDTVLTGAIRMSSSGNMIVASSADPNGGAYKTYSIKLFDTTGINESAVAPSVSLYAKEGTIYLNGEAESIALSDLSGKVVFSSRINGNEVNVGQLQKGVYLVGLDTASGKQFHKIILN